MAAGRRGGIGPACSGGLPEAAPAGAPPHGRATAGPYSASDRPGQRGLYEADRLRASELEGPRSFLRHFGANDAAGFGGICARTPVSETGSGSEKDIARRRCHCISQRGQDLVALDDALQALAAEYPRQAQVVELRFFGELNLEETAEVLHVSAITVMRDWQLAKVWLARELKKRDSNAGGTIETS